MDRFNFFPSGDQARQLDRRVRFSLADSLEHIAERAAGNIPFDFSRLNTIISKSRSGARYPCSTFGIYSEIVLSICNGDDSGAVALLDELVLEQPLGQTRRILALNDPQHYRNVARFSRAMSNDPNTKFFMGPPPEELAREFAQRIEAGYSLMATAMPELAEEFDALVTDVITVVGDEKAEYQFDGGSSYFLWGALFLNATSHETNTAMVEVLAHESAHILLYACTADEALVTNPDEDLFPSPLRRDLRPMDGIYHATFVSARMYLAMDRLMKSGLLAGTDLPAVERARTEDLQNFWSGYEVVARYGRLTKTGSAVMKSAVDYMTSVR